MNKIIAAQKSQKTILKNIAEKINAKLSIFNYSEEDERCHKAFIEEDNIKVTPSEFSNFFTGAVMANIIEVINSYTKKYENIGWYVTSKPVLKFDKAHEIYWVQAPMITIYFNNN